MRRILRRGEVTRDDVFIDIGCGMGPVLVEAAARYDFRRVIGIDVVPEFTEVARETSRPRAAATALPRRSRSSRET